MSNDDSSQDFLNEMFLTKNVKFQDNRLLLMGRPGILLNMGIFSSVAGLLLKYGKKKDLYDAGYSSVTPLVQAYKKIFNEDNKKTFDFLSNIILSSGFGKWNFIFGKDSVITSTPVSPFAESYLNTFGAAKEPVCFFLAGVLSSFFDNLFGKKHTTEEIYCKAAGSSECKFISKVTE
jgi:hypothetical protein